jgi:hypothetical protein
MSFRDLGLIVFPPLPTMAGKTTAAILLDFFRVRDF